MADALPDTSELSPTLRLFIWDSSAEGIFVVVFVILVMMIHIEWREKNEGFAKFQEKNFGIGRTAAHKPI